MSDVRFTLTKEELNAAIAQFFSVDPKDLTVTIHHSQSDGMYPSCNYIEIEVKNFTIGSKPTER
jgi:ribosomal protein L23